MAKLPVGPSEDLGWGSLQAHSSLRSVLALGLDILSHPAWHWGSGGQEAVAADVWPLTGGSLHVFTGVLTEI